MGGAEGAKGAQLRNYVGDSMDLLRQAAQQMVTAMESYPHSMIESPEGCWNYTRDLALDALRAALAQPEQDLQLVANLLKEYGLEALEVIAALKTQPEQEPVASLMTNIQSGDVKLVWNDEAFDRTLWRETYLYTAPPQRKPLTDDQIALAYREIWRDLSDGFSHTSVEWIEAGIRYAEKVHGIE